MNATIAIARKELRVLFASPLAWTLLAAACALAAWWFLLGLDVYGQAQAALASRSDPPGVTDLVVAPYFATLTGLLVFLVPLLTMRGICEEQRAGTLALLFASGATEAAVVMGKYLGVVTFLVLLLVLLAAMPCSLALGTTLDWGKLAAGMLGLLLLGASLAAIGVMASAFAHHPATAALGALALGVLLWMIDSAARAQGEAQSLINYLALPTHLMAPLRGLVASVDLIYFLLLIVLCLSLAIRRVSRLREHG